MPVYHRRSSMAYRRSPRRRTVWANTLISNTSVNSGAQGTAVDLLAALNANNVGYIGGTILRTHVRINTDFATSDSGPGFVFALGVYDSSVARPNPNTDLGSDYMMWWAQSPGNCRTNLTISTSVFCGEQFDLKSRRKLPNFKMDYVLLSFNNGSASASFGGSIRTLIALP